MTFELLIAWSHLRSRKKDAGVSLIALLSIIGVTLGVAVLIIVLSVMTGFEVDLRDKILGSNAHMVVIGFAGPIERPEEALKSVRETPGVVGASPFVYTEVMIRSQFATSGAIMKGIDPATTPTVTDVVRDIKIGPQGHPETLEEKQEILEDLHDPPFALGQSPQDREALPGILIGEELAALLRVYPGDRIWIINPIGGGIGPMGVPIPTTRTFRVAGVFYTGMYEYDTKWTYVTIGDAQEFLSMKDKVNGLEVRVEEDQVFDVEQVSEAVQDRLSGPFLVRNWLDMNAALFSALKLEKYVMGLILTLIVAVAAVGIITNLFVMVITRAREISILRAMGARSQDVMAIFVLEGGIVGLLGTSFGAVTGLAGCVLLDRYRFPLDTNVYYLDSLPVVVEPEAVVVILVSALFICFTATLPPALKAAQLDPVEGLRYE